MSPGTLQELGGKFICEDCKKIKKLDERLQFETELKDESLVFEFPEVENKVLINCDTIVSDFEVGASNYIGNLITPEIKQTIENDEIRNELPLKSTTLDLETIEPGMTHQTDSLNYIKGNRTPKRKGKK